MMINGVEFNIGPKVDLTTADLRGANLIRVDLSRAYLRGADLSGADLSGADLSGVDLSGANKWNGSSISMIGYLRLHTYMLAVDAFMLMVLTGRTYL